MKIAVVTDDNTTLSPHFGRATHYLVFTVEGDNILEKEIRPKVGHHTHSHEHTHGGEHREHRPGEHHHDADRKHRQMVEVIDDCQIVVVGGMGLGAREAFEAAGIRPCSTEIIDAEEAVRAYLGGRRMWQPDCRSKTADSH